MKTYRLNIYSTRDYNLTAFFGILLGMGGLGLAAYFKQSFYVCFGVFGIIMGSAVLLGLKFYKAVAEFSLTDDKFSVRWIKNFSLFRRPEYDFEFSKLKEYVIERWAQTDRLKIRTLNGSRALFEFNHTQKDEETSTEFKNEFKRSILSYNNKDNDPTNDVRVGKNFWQRTPAKIFAIVIGVIIIYAWGQVLLKGKSPEKPFEALIGTIAGAFYIGNVILSNMTGVNERRKGG